MFSRDNLSHYPKGQMVPRSTKLLGLMLDVENGSRRPQSAGGENAPRPQRWVSDYERAFVNALGIIRDELPRHRGEGQRRLTEQLPPLRLTNARS